MEISKQSIRSQIRESIFDLVQDICIVAASLGTEYVLNRGSELRFEMVESWKPTHQVSLTTVTLRSWMGVLVEMTLVGDPGRTPQYLDLTYYIHHLDQSVYTSGGLRKCRKLAARLTRAIRRVFP